jgi:acyl-CoA synthetase (AMP-forming)/AMP-acid ligase II
VGAISAAEPIRPSTVHNFESLFSSFGLREEIICGSYGLAETVVCGCFLFDRQQSVTGPVQGWIAVGKRGHFFSTEIKIVNTKTCREVQDGTIGEVWISGPSVASGYYGKAELSQETFSAHLVDDLYTGTMEDIEHADPTSRVTYLRTGDLGFFECDHLYICGRIKDLIIINGANHYPQDVEFVVQEASSAVRPGCVAAFSNNESSDDGELEIVFETKGPRKRRIQNL